MSSFFPSTAHVCQASDAANLQSLLDQYNVLYLLPWTNYQGSAPALTLKSNQQIYGVQSYINDVHVANGATGVVLYGVQATNLIFDAGSGITKGNRFYHIYRTPITANGVLLENNEFFDLFLEGFGLTIDNSGSGHARYNRFVRTECHGPSIILKGNNSDKSYSNVFTFVNMLTAGGSGMIINTLDDLSLVGVDGESWNWNGSSGEANPLFDIQAGNVVRMYGLSGGQYNSGTTPRLSVNCTEFQLENRQMIDGSEYNPSFIYRANNARLAAMHNVAETERDDATGAFRFKAFIGSDYTAYINGSAVTANQNDSTLTGMLINPVRNGSPWPIYSYPTPPDPGGSSWNSNLSSQPDNTSYLQNLINTNATIPAGTYYIGSPLVISNQQTLIGSGDDNTLIIAKDPNMDMIVGGDHFDPSNGTSAETIIEIQIANVTLQGGAYGFHMAPSGSGGWADYNGCFVANVTFRNIANACFYMDQIYAWDNCSLNNVNFVNCGNAWNQYPDPNWGGSNAAGMCYMDKVVHYRCQFINCATPFNMQAKRPDNMLTFVECLFQANTGVVGHFVNNNSLMFVNCDFQNNQGNPMIADNNPTHYINCRFRLDVSGATVNASGAFFDGCTFDFGTATSGSVYSGTGNGCYFRDCTVNIPIGTYDHVLAINSTFKTDTAFSYQGVSYKTVSGSGQTVVFLNQPAAPSPQALYGPVVTSGSGGSTPSSGSGSSSTSSGSTPTTSSSGTAPTVVSSTVSFSSTTIYRPIVRPSGAEFAEMPLSGAILGVPALYQKPGQQSQTSFPQCEDFMGDYVASGLTGAPVASLTMTTSAGVAIVQGHRVVKATGDGSLTYSYPASTVTYEDIAADGSIYRVSVTLTSSEPTVTANCLRFQSVTTNSNSVTGVSTLGSNTFRFANTSLITDTIYVKDYNVRGGLAYGDTAKIQQALNDAAARVGVTDNDAFVRVSLPAGEFRVETQLTVPAHVSLHCEGVLYNYLSDTYQPCIVFKAGSRAEAAYVNANAAQGIQVGETGKSFFRFDLLSVTNVGKTTDSTKGPMRGVQFLGSDIRGNSVVTQGGYIGIDLSDSQQQVYVRDLQVTSAVTGLNVMSLEHALLGAVRLDSCVTLGALLDGVHDLDAHISVLTTDSLGSSGNVYNSGYAVQVGKTTTLVSNDLRLSVDAVNTGGTALLLSYLDNARIDLLASNGTLRSGNTYPTTKGVEYGANTGKIMTLRGACSASVATPIVGTPTGTVQMTTPTGQISSKQRVLLGTESEGPVLQPEDLITNSYTVTGFNGISGTSGLSTTLAYGTAIIYGNRVSIPSGDSRLNLTVAASQDTYVDLDRSGVFTLLGVANGAAAPALTANALRLGTLISNATTITAWNTLATTTPDLLPLNDTSLGTRTADPTQAPTNNGPGTLTQWVSWISNRIKAILGSANWYDTPANTLTGLQSQKAYIGLDQDTSTTTGLTFGYQAGRVRNDTTVTAIAAGTLALTASATNYVQVSTAGTVSANTTGFTSGQIPLWTVVTNASAITSVSDQRAALIVSSSISLADALGFNENAATTTGLTFGYKAGLVRNDNVVTSVAAGTLTLAASATNYVQVTGAGAVSSNTTGFTSGQIPLWTVTTNASAITGTTDERTGLSVGGASSSTPSRDGAVRYWSA